MFQRKILLLFSISNILFWSLFQYAKSPIDDIKVRLFVSAFCLLGFKLTRTKIPRLRRFPNFIPYTVFCLVVYHSIYLLATNHFQAEFQVQLAVVIIFSSLGFYRKYDLFYFLFFNILLFTPFAVTLLTKLDIYYILCSLLIVSGFSFYMQTHFISFWKQLLANDRSLMRSIDKINDAVIITDTEYYILYVNELAQKFLDFGNEFLIGSKLTMTIPTETRLTGKISTIFTSEKKLIEVRLIKAEREGRPVFFITLKDITEADRIKKEIEKKRILQESILNSIGDGILTIDKDAKIIYQNKESESLTNYSDTEILSKPFHETLHHSWADGSYHEKESSPILETLKERNKNRISNEFFWKKNDNSFPVEYTSSPIDLDSDEKGAVIVYRDTTDKKKIEGIEARYKDGLRFLSDTAMKFLQIETGSDLESYVVETLKSKTNARGIIFNLFTESEEFQTVSVAGFKTIQTSIMKILKSEMIGIEFEIEEDRLIDFTNTYNRMNFLPDGLYSLNYGNLNRKDCIILESLLNVQKVYTITLFDQKVYGSIILLFSDDENPEEAIIEIFSSQVLIALKKFKA
jgi:PAS domain S-box-containing protein